MRQNDSLADGRRSCWGWGPGVRAQRLATRQSSSTASPDALTRRRRGATAVRPCHAHGHELTSARAAPRHAGNDPARCPYPAKPCHDCYNDTAAAADLQLAISQVAPDKTVILLHPPSTFSRCINGDGERAAAE